MGVPGLFSSGAKTTSAVVPYGMSGGGVSRLAGFMKAAKAGTSSTGIIALGDSKTERVDAGGSTGASRPLVQAWTRHLQRGIDNYFGGDVSHFDGPLGYYNDSSTAPCPGFTAATGSTVAANSGTTHPGRGLAITAGGAVARYYQDGANHIAVMISDFGGVSGTFRISVYAGDVSAAGSIPAAGSTTNRLADVNVTTFESSLRVDSWGHNIVSNDQNNVPYVTAHNTMFVIAEALADQANGCTVVVYKGNVSSGYCRVITKRGGTGFQDRYALVVNDGIYGLDEAYYESASASTTYAGTTLGQWRFFLSLLRWRKTYQPWSAGTNHTAVNYGRNACFDNLVCLYLMYTNRNTPLHAFGSFDGTDIPAKVANVTALADKCEAEGQVFCFGELCAINSTTDYVNEMDAIELALSTHPAGVFISIPKMMAREEGVSTSIMRDKVKMINRMTAAYVSAPDGSSLHESSQIYAREGDLLSKCFTYQG